MPDKKQDKNAEGENLLDAYQWFNDKGVMQVFVDVVLGVSKKDYQEGDQIVVLGIGSGTALLEAKIDSGLTEAGFAPLSIATDAITQPSEKAKQNLAGFFMLENKTMSVKSEVSDKNISETILDSGRVADGVVDIVVARSVTHYEDTLEAEMKVLQNVSRILKKDGKFITQAPTPPSPEERQLFIDIHKTLPKVMNVQTKDENKEMLDNVFSQVEEAEMQTDKKLTITSDDFYKRYAPKENDYDSQDEFHKAEKEFSEKVNKIKHLIKSVPKSKRPNIWLEGSEFGWAVPYTIFVCE